MMRPYVIYVCGGGCGYSERAFSWDSPPIGRDSELRCPECGTQAWGTRDLTRREAIDLQEGRNG